MDIQLTASLEKKRSSWEANSRSGSQEITCLLWDPKVHRGVHKKPTLDPALSQNDPVPNLQTSDCITALSWSA